MTVGKQIRKSSLEYGKLAPNFELQATDGAIYTRSQFRGNSGLVLIFFDSLADVRPLLNEIAKDQQEYSELNTRIFAIGHASRETLSQEAVDLKLPFTILADPDGTAWQAYSGSADPGYGVFVLDLYGGADAQIAVDSPNDLPDAKTILQWAQAAQFKCSI